MKTYTDSFGFYAGSVADEFVPTFPHPAFDLLPPDDLPGYQGHKISADGQAWEIAQDNRGRVWYDPASPDAEYVGTAPDSQPPEGYVELTQEGKVWPASMLLAAAKDAAWARIKTARNALEFGSFVYNGLEFDSNQISQQRIGQAAQGAMFAISVGAPFTQDWTLADNSVATFDAQQMINVALAMGQHIGYAHAHSRALRVEIYRADITLEELQQITWSSL
jgi:hypothetical protein